MIRSRKYSRHGLGRLAGALLVGASLGPASASPPEPDFQLVPGNEPQANGPAYDFRIARYEVRNDQFAAFLNDVMLNPADERGQYLYFDLDSGNVFLHPGPDGTTGTSGSGTLLFNAPVNGRIRFDGYRYVVTDEDFESRPVAGVSWYGAVKFCNWLTLVHGMGPDERAYIEGPSVADWLPVEFDPAVPALNKSGYRLPMDGGVNAAAPHNESYKAASRKPDAEGEPVFGARYAFGRDVLEFADANFLHSLDPFDDAPTPVGFFDGVHRLTDATVTRDTENGYGLYDLCGNVAEWVHELDTAVSPTRGATRGGHHLHPQTFDPLRADWREVLPPDSTFAFVGFRVAQSLANVPVRVTQEETEVRAEGLVGGPFSQTRFRVTLHNDAAYALDTYGVSLDVPWLAVETPRPARIPAHASIDLFIRLTDEAGELPLSPAPPGDFARVPAEDAQSGGPDYDFWISRTEVTNDQFLTFLNDAQANPENGRGAYLYFDLHRGDVFVNSQESGGEGNEAPSSTISLRIYDASVGRIHRLNGQYAVETGFGRHPVVGVTWFGAVKYCNWLTLFAGLPAEVRAYAEGPRAEDWRPVMAALDGWVKGTFSDADRERWRTQTLGYRLPMDHESSGASPYNEWFKAAAAATTEDGQASFESRYGFGRNLLTPSDANYLDSHDTAADSTTAVAFFDGVHTLLDGESTTAKSENHYGLADACGNVAEWVHDFFSSDDPSLRAVRGGSWADPIDSPVLTTAGRTALPPDAADAHTGFRVVRGVGGVGNLRITDPIFGTTQTRPITLDLREPFLVEPAGGTIVRRPYCDDLFGWSVTHQLTNQSAAAMPWSIDIDPPSDWITVDVLGPDALSESLAPGGQLDLIVTTTDAGSRLPPGDHKVDLRVTNTRTGSERRLPMKMIVESPFTVGSESGEPVTNWSAVWEGPFDALPRLRLSVRQTTENADECDLEHQVHATAPWLSVTPSPNADASSATSAGLRSFDVTVNAEASQLDVGEYDAAVEVSFVDSANPIAVGPVRYELHLTIEDPLDVTPSDPPWTICCSVSPSDLPSRTYAIANRHSLDVIAVTLAVDQDWLEVEPTRLLILPGDAQSVTLRLNSRALKPHGDYRGRLWITDVSTGVVEERVVVLQVRENLSVTPLNDMEIAGPVGGPFTPQFAFFLAANRTSVPLEPVDWRVTSDQPWAVIDGNATITGRLQPNQSLPIVVELDPASAPQLPPGASELAVAAHLTFHDLTHGDSLTRVINLTLVQPHFELSQSTVQPVVLQPDGPQYTYEMGTFPITNAQFVVFLRGARLNPANPRGEYLYLDSLTGDVYLNTARTGEAGAGPQGRIIRVFSVSASQHIRYVNGDYEVMAAPLDYADHPVTGVSWFGALKFCNWLTLDQGATISQRCYIEGPEGDVAAWRPRSISAADWVSRDLLDEERETLLSRCRGFRLPMDDGYNNLTPTADASDDYNEWFQSAAWNPTLRQNSMYGFGRNTLTTADANYRCSGDPYENTGDCLVGDTTPVGYYDGTVKDGSFLTTTTQNGFGLFDMCGNIHHWLQDRFAPPATLDRRVLRGGSWNDPVSADSLRTSRRTVFAPPSTTSHQIGFRVMRVPAVPTGDLDSDGVIGLHDAVYGLMCAVGPNVLAPRYCGSLDFDGDADVDLSDWAELLNAFDAPENSNRP